MAKTFTDWEAGVFQADASGDLRTIEDAYSTFLDKFPFCFVYWKKYAEARIRLGCGRESANDVYEKSIRAAPYCIHAWQNYCEWFVSCAVQDLHAPGIDSDTHNKIIEATRERFNRAVDAVGLDYNSITVWRLYIDFESKLACSARAVTAILERALQHPINGMDSLWEQFNTHMSQNTLENGLPDADANAYIEKKRDCPVEEQFRLEDETRRAYIARVKAAYDSAHAKGSVCAPYEKIVCNRPYFHVKPVEDIYLRTWRSYLAYEELNSTLDRVKMLYERCIIACCYYKEFWLSYTQYLEKMKQFDAVLDVFKRGQKILGKMEPSIHVEYARACERLGRIDEAKEVLETAQQSFSFSCVEVIMECAGFARRQHDISGALSVLRTGTKSVSDKDGSIYLWMQLCRLVARFEVSSLESTVESMISAHPGTAALWTCALDTVMNLALFSGTDREKLVIFARSLLVRMLGKKTGAGSINSEDRVSWWRRWCEFEACCSNGSNAAEVILGLSSDKEAVILSETEHRVQPPLWIDSERGLKALGLFNQQ